MHHLPKETDNGKRDLRKRLTDVKQRAQRALRAEHKSIMLHDVAHFVKKDWCYGKRPKGETYRREDRALRAAHVSIFCPNKTSDMRRGLWKRPIRCEERALNTVHASIVLCDVAHFVKRDWYYEKSGMKETHQCEAHASIKLCAVAHFVRKNW